MTWAAHSTTPHQFLANLAVTEPDRTNEPGSDASADTAGTVGKSGSGPRDETGQELTTPVHDRHRSAGDPPAGRDGSTSLLATGGRTPSRFGGPNSDNPRLCELAGPGPGLLVLCRSTLSRAVAFEVRCLARAPVRVRRSGRVRELPITRPSLRSSFGHRRPCGHPGNDPTAKRTPLGHGPQPSRATRRHRYTGQPEEDDHEHSRSGRSDSDAAAGLAQPAGRLRRPLAKTSR